MNSHLRFSGSFWYSTSALSQDLWTDRICLPPTVVSGSIQPAREVTVEKNEKQQLFLASGL
jgi:hypothetical protein